MNLGNKKAKNKFSFALLSLAVFGFLSFSLCNFAAAQNIQNNSQNFQKLLEAEGTTVENADPSRFNGIAIVQVLNKTTAKTASLDLKIGEKINFGNLKIIAHKCWQAPLEQRPESKILLEIFEIKNEADKSTEKRVFYGWMFASSPSISGLEHPIYDLTAIGCKNK